MKGVVPPFDGLSERLAAALRERAARERPAVARRLNARATECLAQPVERPPSPPMRVTAPGPLAMLSHLLATSRDDSVADQTPATFDEVLQHELDALLRELEGDEVSVSEQSSPSHLKELSAVRGFRESWLKRHFDKRVEQAIREGPENPGPLNPDMLLVKSLSAMRALSPNYLYRYIAWLDTLLWLEHVGETLPGATVNSTTRPPSATKRSAGRPRKN